MALLYTKPVERNKVDKAGSRKVRGILSEKREGGGVNNKGLGPNMALAQTLIHLFVRRLPASTVPF